MSNLIKLRLLMGQTAGFKIENSIWPRINEKSSSIPRFERNWNWFTDDIVLEILKGW